MANSIEIDLRGLKMSKFSEGAIPYYFHYPHASCFLLSIFHILPTPLLILVKAVIWVLLVLDYVHYCMWGCRKVGYGVVGGLVVKVLYYEPKCPKFQPHFQQRFISLQGALSPTLKIE